ncbi:tyrosine-type recombinase/integrase [Burkholderia multivorans]|uniref:tyrosine-type recombinase/integrase n=1 Tax=Burkholderia multivorans TaxID=87883 RepID=UPI001F163C12|nr:integrase arm-type DNA-binding domain-containing protein [Burkholderia multivorans]
MRDRKKKSPASPRTCGACSAIAGGDGVCQISLQWHPSRSKHIPINQKLASFKHPIFAYTIQSHPTLCDGLIDGPKIDADRRKQALKPTDKPVFDGKVTGLLLAPTKSGCRWILRFTSPVTRKRRDAELGTYPEISLSEAQDKALTMRKLIDNGEDPIDQRNREREAAAVAAAALTFEKAAGQVHEELKPGWKNEKHAAQWISTLETYVFPKVGNRKLNAISPDDCADVLRPIWLTTAETASRTRQRMHAVMQWAWAHGHIAANPVPVVDHILPKQSTKAEHQPAMPWRQVPKFVASHFAKHELTDSTRAALLFLILTTTRSGEVRGATWDEFDLFGRVWNIPAARMKPRNRTAFRCLRRRWSSSKLCDNVYCTERLSFRPRAKKY